MSLANSVAHASVRYGHGQSCACPRECRASSDAHRAKAHAPESLCYRDNASCAIIFCHHAEEGDVLPREGGEARCAYVALEDGTGACVRIGQRRLADRVVPCTEGSVVACELGHASRTCGPLVASLRNAGSMTMPISADAVRNRSGARYAPGRQATSIVTLVPVSASPWSRVPRT